ncbi:MULTISPECIES: TetR/AcrR family transcriptional regulator [unclassified Streptococcus]|uniref:TetR/AcrR family transcriptional regulator n=1 Tax=unclassified Streptococcus TaxID=2608887 RepID=UPI00359ECD8E
MKMTTRERILKQTTELIYRQGYLATSISDIMAASGVGKGQLYHYFASKQAIGLEVVTQLLGEWRSQLLDGILSQENPRQALVAMVDWFFEFHQNQTVFYGCPLGNLIVELSAQEPHFQELLKAFMTDWEEALVSVLQAAYPERSRGACREQAINLLASLQGGIVLVKVHQDLDSLTLVRQRLLQDLGLVADRS